MWKLRYVIILFFVFINFYHGFAQKEKNNINQNLFWLRYHNKILLSSKLEWQTHIDNRIFIFPGKQHHFLARTQMFYKVQPSIDVSQGFVYGLQSPHDPRSTSNLIVPEYRPFQEVVFKNDIGKAQIRHRYRLEERFIRKSFGESLVDGYNFNFRGRYQIQVQFPLIKIDEERSIKLRLAEEVMINIGKKIVYNSFDQNRLLAGFIKQAHCYKAQKDYNGDGHAEHHPFCNFIG